MPTLTIRTGADVEGALATPTRDGRRALVRAGSASLRDDPDEAAASKALLAEVEAVRAR